MKEMLYWGEQVHARQAGWRNHRLQSPSRRVPPAAASITVADPAPAPPALLPMMSVMPTRPSAHLPTRAAAGAAPLPSNDGKKWSQEEVAELLQLVEDEHYRRQRLGLEKVG